MSALDELAGVAVGAIIVGAIAMMTGAAGGSGGEGKNVIVRVQKAAQQAANGGGSPSPSKSGDEPRVDNGGAGTTKVVGSGDRARAVTDFGTGSFSVDVTPHKESKHPINDAIPVGRKVKKGESGINTFTGGL